MSTLSPRVCPACRRPARNRPLPPEGFWQEQVLQRIGMYPYRCEACGARFYRKVPVGQGLGEARYAKPNRASAVGLGTGSGEKSASSPSHGRTVGEGARRSPRVSNPTDPAGESLSHEDFVDLVDHISRTEQSQSPGKKDEDS